MAARQLTYSMGSLIFAAALSAVLLWGGYTFHVLTGDTYEAHMPAQRVSASQWQMIEGEGGAGEQGFELRMGGWHAYAAAAARLHEVIDAESIERIEVMLNPEAARYDVEFGWSTSDALSSFDTHWLAIDETGRGVIEADDMFRWMGEIRYVLIRTRGRLDPPVIIQNVGLHSAKPGFLQLQRRLFSEWVDWRNWTQVSINRALVSHGRPLVSPVVAVAAWIGLFLILRVVFQRLRRIMGLAPALLGIVLLGWIVLDLRWQGELVHKASETRSLFWGKSWAEKRAAGVDGDVFAFLEELKQESSGPDQRLLLFAPYEFIQQRARYFALPMETYTDSWPPRPIVARRVHAGNYLVLVDLPEVEAKTICSDDRCGSQDVEAITFSMEEVVGPHANLRGQDDGQYIELEADGTWLMYSPWQLPPPAGYYSLRASLATDIEGGWVMLQVLQFDKSGEQVEIAERDFYVDGTEFETFELPIAVSSERRVRYRLRTFDAEGLKMNALTLSPRGDGDALEYMVVRHPTPWLVVRPIKQAGAIRAFEVQ